MDKKYTKIIHGVEDMDGTCPYLIGSDKPLPEDLLEELNKTYISIHLLSYLGKKHGFCFEAHEAYLDDE